MDATETAALSPANVSERLWLMTVMAHADTERAEPLSAVTVDDAAVEKAAAEIFSFLED